MRVVIDTNVLVSRYLSSMGPPAGVFAHWEREVFELLVSEPILQEYRRALLYPRVAARHGLSEPQIDGVIARIRELATLVRAEEPPAAVTKDPADDKFLACAVAGAADFIVSGDRHLLDLREYRGIPIFPPAAFLAVLP